MLVAAMHSSQYIYIYKEDLVLSNLQEGSRGVMVIAVGNGHGDTSSNPGRDLLHLA